MADEKVERTEAVDNTDMSAEDYDVPASGGDPDSRMRAMKTNLAAAESTGDDDTADDLRGEVEKLGADMGQAREDHASAAQKRHAAAQSKGSSAESKVDLGRNQPPAGRTAPTRSTTEKGKA
jgi:hypothetical protein